MSSIAFSVHGISYTAARDGDAVVIHGADGALLGRVSSGDDAEVTGASLPVSLVTAASCAVRLVEHEAAEADAEGLRALREAQSRPVAAAHWAMTAALERARAEHCRGILAELAALPGVAA